MINFDLIEEIKLDNFKGGDGSVIAKIFTDNNNKIMKATLKKDPRLECIHMMQVVK